jgi:hypothetical protein
VEIAADGMDRLQLIEKELPVAAKQHDRGQRDGIESWRDVFRHCGMVDDHNDHPTEVVAVDQTCASPEVRHLLRRESELSNGACSLA